MNLEELLALLKKFKVYLIIAGAILLVFWGIYYYFDNPTGDRAFGQIPQPNLVSNVSDKLKLKSDQTLSGSLPHLIDVYKLSGTVDPESVKNKLGVEGGSVTDKNLTRWDSLTKEFIVNTTEQTFSYRLKSNVGSKSYNEEQAFNAGIAVLKNLGLVGPEVSLGKVKTDYLFGSFYHVEQVTEKDNYNIYAFEIEAKLNGLNIIDTLGSKSLYRIQVGVDGQVRNIDASLQRLIFSEKSTYPVKHLPQIKSEIGKNKATIVKLELPTLPAANQTLAIKYTQGQLGYLLPVGKAEYLQPVVLLENTELFNTSEVSAMLAALKNFSYQN